MVPLCGTLRLQLELLYWCRVRETSRLFNLCLIARTKFHLFLINNSRILNCQDLMRSDVVSHRYQGSSEAVRVVSTAWIRPSIISYEICSVTLLTSCQLLGTLLARGTPLCFVFLSEEFESGRLEWNNL